MQDGESKQRKHVWSTFTWPQYTDESPISGLREGHSRGAARMRPKRPWTPPKKLVKIFRWCFISISTVRKQTKGTIGLM